MHLILDFVGAKWKEAVGVSVCTMEVIEINQKFGIYNEGQTKYPIKA